jgi:hypothetical protein
MAITIAPLRPSRWQGDPARHREPVDDDLSATRRPGYGPAHVRLADRYIQARAVGDAVGLLSMRPVDVDPRPRRPAVTADDRHAWRRLRKGAAAS